MPKLYEFEGLGQFEFPDDASNEEIQSWVDQYASKKAGVIESFRRFPSDVAAAALSSTSSMLALGDPEPGEVGRGWDFEKEARRAEEKKAALQGGYAPGRGSGPSFGGTSALFGQGYRSKIPSEQATTSDWLPEQFLKAPVTSGGGARGFDLPDQTREALKSEVEASREASRIGAAGEEVAQEIKDNAYGYSKPFIRDTLSSVGSVVPTALVGAISPGAAIGAAAAQAGGSKYLENKKRYEAQGIDPVEADRMARQDAVPAALITGGVTFGFGKLFGGGIERILNAKQGVRKAMAEEIGEEATDKALQLAVDKQRARPELTFGEALTEVVEAGAAGGFGAGVLKGSVKVAQKIFSKPEDKPKEKAVVDLVSNAAENAPVSSAVAAGMAQVVEAPTDSDLDAALEALKTTPPSSAAADQTTGTQGRVQPEPASTINAQVVLAADPASTRKAVLLTPQDDGWEPNIPEGIDAVETKHGIVLYNPDKISEEEVVKAGQGDTFDATILGLGTSERPGDQTPDQLVVATKDRTGVVVAETVTDGSPGQIQAVTDAHQQAVPGGTTSITTADETVRKRTLEIEAERLAAERGDGKRAGTPPVQAPVEQAPAEQTPPVQDQATKPELAQAQAPLLKREQKVLDTILAGLKASGQDTSDAAVIRELRELASIRRNHELQANNTAEHYAKPGPLQSDSQVANQRRVAVEHSKQAERYEAILSKLEHKKQSPTPIQKLRFELASAIEQSDIPSSMVDIVESEEEFDVAYDPKAKRFKVNLKKVQSPESVALKLHTHEKLHFVVDMLVEQGKEKESLKLIEDMAALAPDDLIRQINRFYSGDSRELTEEQAAYVASTLAGNFVKQDWFKNLVLMVKKVLSQVTGNTQTARLVAAEMAAGRIQALSEEFIAQRKSGRIPKGSLKTSKSKTGIDAITATDDFGGLKRSDPRIRMAPTQRFGKEEGQLHEQQRINETFGRLLAQGHLSKDSPLNAANTELAHQTFQRFIDPVAGVSFAAEIREKTGVMGPGLLQVTLRLYADKMLASGDASLRRALYEHQFLPEGAKPSDSAMEGAQRMRARQEYSSIVDDSLNYFKDTLPNEHLDDKNGAGIGPEVKQAVNNAVVNTTTTPDDISSPSGPTPRVKNAVETLNNIKPPVDETVDEETDEEGEPEEDEEFEGDKIVKRWTNRIQLEQTEWLKPDEKIHEVEMILRAALKDKAGMTNLGKSFRTQLVNDLVNAGVNKDLAVKVAYEVHNKRLRKWAASRVKKTESVAAGRAKSGEFRKPDLWFLAKEILDAPVSQQLDQAWRKEVARRFYQKRGLAPDQVEAAIRLFEHVFTEKLAAAQFEAAKKALDGIRDQDGKITLDKNMDKLMRAIRSRLLDPSASFVEKLAEQFGFVSPLTHKQFNRLKKLDADLATTRSPRHRGMIFREKASIINAAKRPKLFSVEGWKRFTERLQAYYTANALSSIGVFNANVVSPAPSTLFRLLFELPVSITKGSQAIDHMAGTVMIMVNAVKNAAIDLKFSAVKDTYQTLEYREVAEMSALADFMASGFRKLKSPNTSNLEKVAGSFEMAVGMVDVVRRIFSISDNFHQMIIRDFVEGIHIRDQAMIGKMTAQNATLLATGATIATERFQQEAASFGLTGLAADAYVGDMVRESVLKVYEDIGGDPVALQELAKNEAQLTTGNYMGVSKAKETGVSYDTGSPIGMGTDKLVESSEYLIHKLPVIGRMVGGFVRVVYNINEQTFNWTPAGLMRIGYRSVILNTFGIDTYKKSLGEAYQRRIVAQKATVGTLFMVAAAYLIWGGDDDDEWVIDVTSDSTITSLEFRNMLKTVGIRPGSFFMRNKKTGEVRTLKYNSAVMENFKWGGVILGVIRDLERSGKLDLTDGRKMETFGLLVWNMLKGVADNSRNFGLGSVADLQGRLSSPKGWASFAGFSLSPFLPAAGLVSSVRRLFEDKPAHDTFRSSFFASFAYAPADERKPALNWLGQPINGTFQSTPERVAAAATLVGLPFSVQVPANDPSWPIYDLFFEKGATPPWYQIKDVEDRLGVPLTGDQWYEYVKKRGGLVRQKILRNLDALKRMSTKDVDSALGRYSKEALVEVESKMEKDITNTRKAKSKKVPELLKR